MHIVICTYKYTVTILLNCRKEHNVWLLTAGRIRETLLWSTAMLPLFQWLWRSPQGRRLYHQCCRPRSFSFFYFVASTKLPLSTLHAQTWYSKQFLLHTWNYRGLTSRLRSPKEDWRSILHDLWGRCLISTTIYYKKKKALFGFKNETTKRDNKKGQQRHTWSMRRTIETYTGINNGLLVNRVECLIMTRFADDGREWWFCFWKKCLIHL